MKARIRLDTLNDVREFVNIASSKPFKISVTDGKGLCVNAKSMMGVLYSMEFDEIWCESAEDIWHQISKFVVD